VTKAADYDLVASLLDATPAATAARRATKASSTKAKLRVVP
jgi:hypothetical protein